MNLTHNQKGEIDVNTFTRPVYLKDGHHMVREIASVDEAIEYLMDWPDRERDVLHETTLRTCVMAHDGLKPVKVARDALRAFAVKKKLLEKKPAVKPWMLSPNSAGASRPEMSINKLHWRMTCLRSLSKSPSAYGSVSVSPGN